LHARSRKLVGKTQKRLILQGFCAYSPGQKQRNLPGAVSGALPDAFQAPVPDENRLAGQLEQLTMRKNRQQGLTEVYSRADM
jgi:hypothetical protein